LAGVTGDSGVLEVKGVPSAAVCSLPMVDVLFSSPSS